MATNYPGALDSSNLPNPTGTSSVVTVDHAGQHSTANDAIKALEAKLGTGVSSPSTTGNVLVVTATGATGYQPLFDTNSKLLPTKLPAVITSGEVALSDASTIAIDASLGNEFTVTLGGNHLFANPTNPSTSQKMVIRIKQDVTGSRVPTWDTIYRFSGGVPPTLTTTGGKTDYLGFVYNATDNKWDMIAFVPNY